MMSDCLPLATFLVGGTLTERRRIAQMIVDSDIAGCFALSLYRPIREGMLGTFFHCDPSIDMERPDIKLPGLPDTTAEAFCQWYETALTNRYGNDVLARIAVRFIEENVDYYQAFIFEDLTKNSDLHHFVREAGAKSCLLLCLDDASYHSYDWAQPVRRIRIQPNADVSVLEQLDAIRTAIGAPTLAQATLA